MATPAVREPRAGGGWYSSVGAEPIRGANSGERPRLVQLAAVLALLAGLFAPAARAEAPVEKKARALLAEWKPKFDAEKFNYLVAGPFVVAGDGSRSRLERYRDDTILAAARALHEMYFDSEPAEPVLILLFESAGPYKRLGKKWFGYDDVPHFGLYRRDQNVMLMNVGTGTGTLVHELVHALIQPDFPGVPHWFNEGLGSLYEQCSISRDRRRITGHENWRLPALKQAIRKGELRPLREMIDNDNFYAAGRVGMNYAQARYLLMYLQHKDLLTAHYARFRESVEDDRSGLKTLESLIAPKSLDACAPEWRRWVLSLHFNG